MPQLQYYPVRETLFSAEAGTRYVSFGLRCCAPEQGVPQLAFIPDVSSLRRSSWRDARP